MLPWLLLAAALALLIAAAAPSVAAQVAAVSTLAASPLGTSELGSPYPLVVTAGGPPVAVVIGLQSVNAVGMPGTAAATPGTVRLFFDKHHGKEADDTDPPPGWFVCGSKDAIASFVPPAKPIAPGAEGKVYFTVSNVSFPALKPGWYSVWTFVEPREFHGRSGRGGAAAGGARRLQRRPLLA
jgi:hypothetical protein